MCLNTMPTKDLIKDFDRYTQDIAYLQRGIDGARTKQDSLEEMRIALLVEFRRRMTASKTDVIVDFKSKRVVYQHQGRVIVCDAISPLSIDLQLLPSSAKPSESEEPEYSVIEGDGDIDGLRAVHFNQSAKYANPSIDIVDEEVA